MNATPERSTFRNGTIWKGTIAFPCERGLSVKTLKCCYESVRFEIMLFVFNDPEVLFSFLLTNSQVGHSMAATVPNFERGRATVSFRYH